MPIALVFFCFLLLFSPFASGAYKCINEAGEVSYQSMSCQQGWEQVPFMERQGQRGGNRERARSQGYQSLGDELAENNASEAGDGTGDRVLEAQQMSMDQYGQQMGDAGRQSSESMLETGKDGDQRSQASGEFDFQFRGEAASFDQDGTMGGGFNNAPPASSLSGMASILSFVVFLIFLAAFVLTVVATWMLFARAGEPGWGALIPIFSYFLYIKISGRPWWLLVVLLLLPPIGFIIHIIVTIDFVRAYGKGMLYGIGMSLLPFIFLPMLAFDKEAEYLGV